MKNNYAFIDGQNLHFGIKSLGWKLDHKKFRSYLEKEHGVSRAYIFLGFMEEHQDLYNVLQEAGFICFFKPLVRYDEGVIKGNVDADMVLQVMVDIENYEKAIIVTGDGDFSGLLRHLLYKKKLGQVIIPNRDKYSSLFDRLEGFDQNHVTYMNDLRSQLGYHISRKPHKASLPKPGKVPKPQALSKTTINKTKSSVKTQSKPQDSQKPRQKYNKSTKQAERSFKPKSELEKSLIDTINNNPS